MQSGTSLANKTTTQFYPKVTTTTVRYPAKSTALNIYSTTRSDFYSFSLSVYVALFFFFSQLSCLVFFFMSYSLFLVCDNVLYMFPTDRLWVFSSFLFCYSSPQQHCTLVYFYFDRKVSSILEHRSLADSLLSLATRSLSQSISISSRVSDQDRGDSFLVLPPAPFSHSRARSTFLTVPRISRSTILTKQ